MSGGPGSAWRLVTSVGATLAFGVVAGCGAGQSVKDTSAKTAHAIFTTRVKHMDLDLASSADLNRDERGAALPVAIHVYQLKDAHAFEAATYGQLLADRGDLLRADVVNRTDTVLGPRATVVIKTPMASDAHDVGVVAFFRDPSTAAWRLVIPVEQWKHTDPVTVSVADHTLSRAP